VSDALLLCELHAHTTWSDGQLTLRELVDLHGGGRFDVLCVTDHVVRSDDPSHQGIDASRWPAYIHELDREAQRALRTYGLLLIPGLELTDNDDDPDLSAHALALGLRRHVPVDDGIVEAIRAARADGAAIVAAHPYTAKDSTPLRPTRRFAHELDLFRDLVDRWELFNRNEVFSWVADERLPAIATGDVHRSADVASWKTLLPCEKDEAAVVTFLRSNARAYLTPFTLDLREPLPAAA
jgi:predicted metal-dependent phosphoesterase TrpH